MTINHLSELLVGGKPLPLQARSPVVEEAARPIPAVGETVAGYEAVQWAAVLGPKALPKDIVARWNSEINRILQLPDVKARMAGDGMEPVDGSPERLREVLKRDVAKWQNVVKLAGIKPGT